MYKNHCISSQINHPVVLVPLPLPLCAHPQSSQKALQPYSLFVNPLSTLEPLALRPPTVPATSDRFVPTA